MTSTARGGTIYGQRRPALLRLMRARRREKTILFREHCMETETVKKKGMPKAVKYILSFLIVTLLCVVLVLLGVVWVLEKGPSPTVTETFTRSVRETSAIRWVSQIFLSEEELAQYKSVSSPKEETSTTNTSLIHLPDPEELAGEDDDGYELIDISEGTCKGKLLIVYDPKRVILGTSDNFGRDAGWELTDMVERYGAIAGINAGGFNDEGGHGNGSTPQGLVIDNGEVTWGANHIGGFHVVGLDEDGILRVGFMTVRQAVDAGIRWAVSFETYDGLASALIINGEVQTRNLGGGVNPRTAIGQREDGALLLLVLDGRSVSTLGATMRDICDIMLEYGAVNAGNLDGGSSTVMVYDGEIINNCASVVGPRRIPTAFLLMKEGDVDG